MIYELRVYEVMPGKMDLLHRRFASVVIRLFERHGIRPVGFWTEEIGTSNRLVYLLAYESLADRERKWHAFTTDPEWRQVFDEGMRTHGPLTVRITNTILRPTPYSPMQ